MVLEFLEPNDFSQEAPVPIMFDFVCQSCEEGTVPLEHFQEPVGGGQSKPIVFTFVRRGIDFGDEGGVLWVIAARISCNSPVRKLFDPMCGFEKVVLDGDDEAGGKSITVEGEALGALFGGAMVLDAGLQVFHVAVLMPQQLTLYSPFSLESLPFFSVISLPSPDRLDEALGDPYDRLKVSLSDCQCGGRHSRGDGLNFGGWEAGAGW